MNVQKKFGARVALHGLDLEVPQGEIFGLLGHNGAGKSTAIGMMLGQVWPTSGVVRVCGHEVTTHRARALQKVGAIFEAPAFYDYLSGRRNLEILSQYSGPTSVQRIREVVEWVGLTGREESKVKTYSHGMRARLAIAQALLPQPELLIFDEPGSGLDPEGIAEMRQTILRLHREMGLTILLSSHLLSEVEQLCSRIAVLNRGRKVFDGRLADAKGSLGRLMLKTPDFAAATRLLREGGIITDAAEGKFIVLCEGRTTAEAVKALVNANISVGGIWQQEQTLEDFYLSLIKAPPTPDANN
ncbi:MAG TPA: ABC transporter ATP-binding protein [Candidatus Acidoferrum sp.]|nr:ABC transporter ATP-binding protein [Candidatus Acidoferrum sp.]